MLGNATVFNKSTYSLRFLRQSLMRFQSTTAPKIEIFIDDKKVLVDPGMTILQVCIVLYYFNFRHVRLWELIFLASVIMIDFLLLVIVECV